jgi:hypothetical protein
MNCLAQFFYFLEDLKNHPSPGLRNLKRESNEMRAGVRVPDQPGIRLSCLT